MKTLRPLSPMPLLSLLPMFPLLALLTLLSACTQPRAAGDNSALNSLSDKQQSSARTLAHDYLRCVERISDRTDQETFPDLSSRRDMILESCADSLDRFTVVMEQSLSNHCMSKPGSQLAHCDGEAVSKARHESSSLKREATQFIDSQIPARRLRR